MSYLGYKVGSKTLVIGAGEIGQSLCNVLRDRYEVHIRDVDDPGFDCTFSVLNICYPYSDAFVDQTKAYLDQYNPSLTIIHSTVKPGTTRLLGPRVAYSPVIGRHPHLEEGIRTFTKFVGAVNVGDAEDARVFLSLAGIKTELMDSPETAELAKILCTTSYGWSIILQKEICRICQKWGVPFSQVYTAWNTNYNAGYQALGEGQFTRPILKHMEGKISGHCVVNNSWLLDDFVTDLVIQRNERY